MINKVVTLAILNEDYLDERIFNKIAKSLSNKKCKVIILNKIYDGQTDNITFKKITFNKENISKSKICSAYYKEMLLLNSNINVIFEYELLSAAVKLSKKNNVYFDINNENILKSIDIENVKSKPFLKRIICKLKYNIFKNKLKALNGLSVTTIKSYKKYRHINRNTELVYDYPVIQNNNIGEKLNKITYFKESKENYFLKNIIETATTIDYKVSVVVNKEDYETLNEYDNVEIILKNSCDDLKKAVANSKIAVFDAVNKSKLYYSMSFGLAIILNNDEHSKRIIEHNSIGVAVNLIDKEELTATLKYFSSNDDVLNDLGKCGQNLTQKSYNWNTEEKKLFILYNL